MTSPQYYFNPDLKIIDDALVGAGADAFFAALGNLIASANAGTKTIYFVVSTLGSSATVIEYEAYFDGNGHIEIDDTLYSNASVGLVGALAAAAGIGGLPLIAVVAGTSFLNSYFGDPLGGGLEFITTGNFDMELKLIDSSANSVLAGAIYDVPVDSEDLPQAVSSLLNGIGETGDPSEGIAVTADMVIEVHSDSQNGALQTFRLYDGSIAEHAANLFFGGDIEAFKAYGGQGNPDNGNGRYYSETVINGATHRWIIARDLDETPVNPDLLLIPGDDGQNLMQGFHPQFIWTANSGQFVFPNTADDGLYLGDSQDSIGVFSLHAGDGDDWMYGGGGDDILHGQGGDDWIFGDFGSATSDNVFGATQSGNDELYGGDGADHIFGGAGNDLLVGGNGDNYLDGGDGADTVDYSQLDSTLRVEADLGAGGAYIIGPPSVGLVNTDTLIGIENIRDTRNNDMIRGSDANNQFWYTGGADHYYGGAGNDVFYIEVPAAINQWVKIAGQGGSNSAFINANADEFTVRYQDGAQIFTHNETGGEIWLSDMAAIEFGGVTFFNIDQESSGQSIDLGSGDKNQYVHIPSDSGFSASDVRKTTTVDENGDTRTVITFGGPRTNPETGEAIIPPTITVDGDGSNVHIITMINGVPELWVTDPAIYVYPPGFFSGVSMSEYSSTVVGEYAVSDNTGSPLCLDLDGDGIELISLANTTLRWDIDEDGFAEASGWVAADDGLLAVDLNSDGIVTDHTELFGSLTEDGFTALSVYDTNTDGVIDANDAQFADLLVWQDANQNGYSEAAELYSLADLDIVSINLGATEVTQTIEGNDISHVSTYTVDDGVSGPQTLDIVDAWFAYDDVNTHYALDYDLDPATVILPTLRGYGDLPSLNIAMSLDNDFSSSDSLLSLVADFAAKDFGDLFVDDVSVLAQVRDIMFRWAGMDDVAADSRGDHVDARELGFLEQFVSSAYNQGYDPGGNQGEALSYTFDVALQPIAARLIAQAAGKALFEGDVLYNLTTDVFDGITGLSQSALDTLLAKSQDGAQVSDKMTFWGDVVRVIDQIVGVSNLSSEDAAALETAITISDPTLSTQLILGTLEWNSHVGGDIPSTSGDDILEGTSGDDTIYGGYGDDEINGGIGDDTLRGQAHNDILNGQSGDDFLYGASGTDTYLYFAGQGHDTITEQSSGSDKIVFGPGVTFSDLTLTRISNTDLQIDLSDAVGGGAVTIINQFGNANTALVELLEFNDNSTVDLSTVTYTLTGTDGADTLKGIRYGGSQDDTIYGLDGDDTITGYFSTLDYGDNWLYGGAGNDTIYGAHGVDFIDGGADDDYIRGYNGNDEIRGGIGNDELLGGNQNDILYGGAGADILKGENHNDVLIGGFGADELWGGGGYDTFTFLDGEIYDAVDTIEDFHSTYDAIDISDMLSAYDPLADAITDFVRITDKGSDSTLAVDIDGGADGFVTLALIVGKTGLTDEAALEANGTLITA